MIYTACVARSVAKAEVARTPAAQGALLTEWDKLRKVECWDGAKVG